jgi:serine protease
VKTIRRIFPLLAFLLLCSPASRATNFQTLLPRPPALPSNAYRLPEKTEIGRIVVKFQEGTHVRLRNQRLVMLERNDRERAAMASRGLDLARVNAGLATIHGLIARDVRARGLDRLFKEDEELLAARHAIGEARTGQELADLDLYYEILVPEGTTQGEVKDIIGSLKDLASVEVAYGEPVPETPQTATPNTIQSFRSHSVPMPEPRSAKRRSM